MMLELSVCALGFLCFSQTDVYRFTGSWFHLDVVKNSVSILGKVTNNFIENSFVRVLSEREQGILMKQVRVSRVVYVFKSEHFSYFLFELIVESMP